MDTGGGADVLRPLPSPTADFALASSSLQSVSATVTPRAGQSSGTPASPAPGQSSDIAGSTPVTSAKFKSVSKTASKAAKVPVLKTAPRVKKAKTVRDRWTGPQLAVLLEVLHEVKPIGHMGWQQAAEEFAKRTGNHNWPTRDSEQMRAKYHQLKRAAFRYVKPTGETEVPAQHTKILCIIKDIEDKCALCREDDVNEVGSDNDDTASEADNDAAADVADGEGAEDVVDKSFISGSEERVDKAGMVDEAAEKLEQAQAEACVPRAKLGRVQPATKALASMADQIHTAVQDMRPTADSNAGNSDFIMMMLAMENSRRADRDHQDRIRAQERERERAVESARANMAERQQEMMQTVMMALLTKLAKE